MAPEDRLERYDPLIRASLGFGARDTVIITSSAVVVEERIGLKCRTGCPSYGTSLSCPPYAPGIGVFRRMLAEYAYVLVIRFVSQVRADETILHALMKNRYDPAVAPELRDRTMEYMDALNQESRRIHDLMLGLERIAFQAGMPFALAFTPDSCDLCKKCNVKNGICLHPEKFRYPLEAVGINVIKTAAYAGIQIQFPCPIPPDRIALLLIE